jgi:N-acetylneuraminic acid mutarotase
VQFNDKNIDRRINSSIVSVDNKIYLFGGALSGT